MAKRILFAEDDEMNRDLYVMVLSESGYEVIAVEDGQKAWDTYQEKKGEFDGLLTDVDMPGMNGLELMGKIRQVNPKFPIAAYTGLPENVQKIKEKWADIEVIQKPCRPHEVINAIGKTLEKKL